MRPPWPVARRQKTGHSNCSRAGHPDILPQTSVWFQGIRLEGGTSPPCRPLTEVRKSCNRALNSLRAAVERAISHLVNWKMLDLGYRGRISEFPDVLRTVTNLEIYRTRA
jgi:hypothetical protein